MAGPPLESRFEEGPMCPACMASVSLMVTGMTSIGSLTAFAVKRLRTKVEAAGLEAITQSKGDQDGYINPEQTRSSQTSVPS